MIVMNAYYEIQLNILSSKMLVKAPQIFEIQM